MAAAVDNWMIWSHIGIHGLGVKNTPLSAWLLKHLFTCSYCSFPVSNHCYTVTQATRLWTSFVFLFCFSFLWIKDSTFLCTLRRNTPLNTGILSSWPRTERTWPSTSLMAWRRGSKKVFWGPFFKFKNALEAIWTHWMIQRFLDCFQDSYIFLPWSQDSKDLATGKWAEERLSFVASTAKRPWIRIQIGSKGWGLNQPPHRWTPEWLLVHNKPLKVRLFVGLVSLNRTCKSGVGAVKWKTPAGKKWQWLHRDYILSSPAIPRVKGILFVFDCWTTNNWIDLLENWWETLGKSPSKMICYELLWGVQSIPPYLSLGPPPLTTKRRTAKFASDREQLGDPGTATKVPQNWTAQIPKIRHTIWPP